MYEIVDASVGEAAGARGHARGRWATCRLNNGYAAVS